MKKQKEKQKNKKSVCGAIFCKENLVRDIVITAMSIGLMALLITNHKKLSYKLIQPEAGKITEQAVMEENEAENPTIDTTDWKTYQTQWYGFELKYPDNWKKPVLKSATKGAKWEYRYEFRKSEINDANHYIGFDVVVYNVNKIKELSGTDEFPTVKNEELKEQGACQTIEGHLAENEDYPAEQIYIPSDDDCYNPAYFYTLTSDDYMYNIVPILSGEEEKTIQSEKEIIQNIPEFISAASTFNLIDIKRPKASIEPVVRAPMPYVYDVDSLGRKVCNHKHDHPHKSDKKDHKKGHMDMECCLDPDEVPNPNCYYDPDVYGKYL
ncbi:MAG: hypothetical protein WC906_03405 [Parcubacteria group bacterium]|jgi:hypothetical protein